jgi:hypothetical protein
MTIYELHDVHSKKCYVHSLPDPARLICAHHQSDAFCLEAYAEVFDEAKDREVEAEIRKEREVENN